jgi:hypothetical protein
MRIPACGLPTDFRPRPSRGLVRGVVIVAARGGTASFPARYTLTRAGACVCPRTLVYYTLEVGACNAARVAHGRWRSITCREGRVLRAVLRFPRSGSANPICARPSEIVCRRRRLVDCGTVHLLAPVAAALLWHSAPPGPCGLSPHSHTCVRPLSHRSPPPAADRLVGAAQHDSPRDRGRNLHTGGGDTLRHRRPAPTGTIAHDLGRVKNAGASRTRLMDPWQDTRAPVCRRARGTTGGRTGWIDGSRVSRV